MCTNSKKERTRGRERERMSDEVRNREIKGKRQEQRGSEDGKGTCESRLTHAGRM